VDLNPLIVEKEKALGLPIIYGNASNESVLKELKINDANCIIIATSNYESTLTTIDAARRLNPDIHIIVRTRYLKNVDEVYAAGADVVIPEEFETSIVIFTKLMDYYNKDVDEITDTIDTLRSDNYYEFRSVAPDELTTKLNENLTDLMVESLYVKDKKQLDDYEFKKHDLTVTAIIRDNKTILGISPKFELIEDDLILFTGSQENIEFFLKDYYNVDGGI
jgi:CPA2 family monovalent cation:H+ antiporter-2